MNIIKHSKFKNTGFLFEILIMQLSNDIINDNENKKSFELLRKYFFKEGKQIKKQFMLYNILTSDKTYSKDQANDLISQIVKIRGGMNLKKLQKQKYFLIKQINKYYNSRLLFQTKIENYKLLGSIYKLFKLYQYSSYNPQTLIQNKYIILQYLQNKKQKKISKRPKFINEFLKQSQQIKILSYNILLEQFKKHYESLLPQQQILLKKYLNGLGNISIIKQYLQKQKTKIIQEMKLLKNKYIKQLRSKQILYYRN